MPTFHVSPPLRGPTNGEALIPVDAANIRAGLDALEARFPGFRQQVLTPAGEPNRFVRFFLNGRPLAAVSALDEPVSAADEVLVLAAIAGG